MKALIEAGAAGVHFEDQLASAKKCGHMGGKVREVLGPDPMSICAASSPSTCDHSLEYARVHG
jgi:2-methylisocitrate lyase-like PEP mutase family enzyme